ncbi:MAG TPA: hypothetical protein VGE53_02870 [Candidatus Paceibacterota bacterium]
MIRSALIALALLLGGVAHAQALPGAEPLTVLLSPEHPRPYQSFQVSPRSSLIDLSASTVRVSVDGTQVYEGSGTQAATVRAGALGTRTNVTVSVTDAAGKVYTKQISVRPAEVSLVLEPASTAHPFYKGGGLVASEGTVRLIALADLRTSAGVRIPPQNLVYTWRLGDRVLTDASGIGKSALTATAPVRYRNADISVTVSSADSSLVAEARTLVSAVDPVARVYQNDPLLGPNFDMALASRFSMPDTEATFRAVGYFFAVPPVFSWNVNSSSGGSDKDVTVRATGNGTGTARLSLTATESESRRSASSAFTVDFGSARGFGFFGL